MNVSVTLVTFYLSDLHNYYRIYYVVHYIIIIDLPPIFQEDSPPLRYAGGQGHSLPGFAVAF